MLRQLTLYERHSLTQHRHIAFAYAFHIFGSGDVASARTCLELEIGVGHWRLSHALVHRQAGKFLAIFGMLDGVVIGIVILHIAIIEIVLFHIVCFYVLF